MNASPRVTFLGADTLLVELGTGIDAATNRRVHAMAARIRAAAIPGVLDLIPAYASLGVRYDPSYYRDSIGSDPATAVAAVVIQAMGDIDATSRESARTIEIPVCYGGDHGPDLADVARHAGMSVEAAIERHAGAIYTVAMLGFAPGFPYLLGLDSQLHTPRRPTPRTRVPAGSVAIGGAQTGIYPCVLPGGWQLIGRTPEVLFHADRDPPNRLAPGDIVRFVPISQAAFDLRSQSHAP
ncbi:5-oxoprolinase subunit PxpB [Tahibacter amnicola]|uniref:5-oxoprolinase subunit PxpB n=1 Tax=Tahibacter amnicola TaxID=2976241 RepID=A0ABY6BIH3_9GAMM|nr:5-oxoprolinase subunit PxpB [Tahibacter amnicola]MCU7372919.1 5-oxoprolinase subunit PxpB [Paucibacter sp. O1-1]MDA3827915.1 5-oxoprolinase subunit PxpB [Paucibacter sp. O1-1]UXI69557.1 5-oxoprolinase subunit PxpB [Tahibacter amnicola]